MNRNYTQTFYKKKSEPNARKVGLIYMTKNPSPNKELIKKWVELFSKGDAKKLADLYTDDAVNHQVTQSPVYEKDAIRKCLKMNFQMLT